MRHKKSVLCKELPWNVKVSRQEDQFAERGSQTANSASKSTQEIIRHPHEHGGNGWGKRRDSSGSEEFKIIEVCQILCWIKMKLWKFKIQRIVRKAFLNLKVLKVQCFEGGPEKGGITKNTTGVPAEHHVQWGERGGQQKRSPFRPSTTYMQKRTAWSPIIKRKKNAIENTSERT